MSSNTVKPTLLSGTMTLGVAGRGGIVTSIHETFTIISIMYLHKLQNILCIIYQITLSVVNGVHHKIEVGPKILLY